jgi:hypothetical protein
MLFVHLSLITGNLEILLHIKLFHLLTDIDEIILNVFEHRHLGYNQLPQTIRL